MPIAVTCPNGHALKLDPKYEGKRVRCSKCQAIFLVDSQAVTAEASARAAPPPPPEVDPLDELEDRPRKRPRDEDEEDEEDDDRPRKRRRDEEDEEDDDRPRKRRRNEDEEDEEDDDRPRKRRRDEEEDDEENDDRPRKRRRDEEEDDEENDDRPRKRRRRDEEDEDEDDEDRPRKRRRDDDDEDDDDDDDRDRGGRKAKQEREQMRSVASGMGLFAWKYLVLAVTCGIGALIPLMMMIGGLAPGMGAVVAIVGLILLVLIGLCYLAAIVLGIIAACMVMKIPSKSGAGGLVIAFLGCECAYVIVSIVHSIIGTSSIGFVLNMGNQGPGPGAAGLGGAGMATSVLLPILGLAAFILVMIVFRLTAMYVKSKKAAKMALVYMIVAIVTPIVGFVLLFVAGIIGATMGPRAAIILAAIFLMILLGAMAFIMERIRGVCKMIREKAAA